MNPNRPSHVLIRIAKNLARFVVTFLAATLAVFGIMRVLPGDPAAIAAGENATPELIAQLAKEFGTDRPLPEQYWDWFSGLLRGDFGVSYVTRTDISPLVLDKVQVSLILVTLAMLLALAIAIPLGILAAVRHGKPSGALVSGLSQLGIAIPGFLLGILLVSFVSLRLGWLPANGWTPPGQDFGDFLRRIILPVTALAGVQSAILMRYVRSAVLEVMHEDYLRTARAKGLSPARALLKHGLRNAAIPVLTVTSRPVRGADHRGRGHRTRLRDPRAGLHAAHRGGQPRPADRPVRGHGAGGHHPDHQPGRGRALHRP